MAISNKYKDIFDEFIDSSNTESSDQPKSPDWPGPIDKGTRNALRSRGALLSLLEEDCLDEDVLVTALERAPKTQNSQVYKCHNIILLGPKNGRIQYGKGQKSGEDEKDKKSGENGRVERGGRDYCRNKVNLVVEESSSFKLSVYHHIIYWCYQKLMILG